MAILLTTCLFYSILSLFLFSSFLNQTLPPFSRLLADLTSIPPQILKHLICRYATAFPPIWLAAAASLGFFHPDLPAITAAAATVNSIYSYLVRYSL